VGLALTLSAALGLGYWLWPRARASLPHAGPAPRSAEGRASAALLAHALAGVELDMSLAQVARVRPALRPHPPADLDGLEAHHERLDPDHRALYFFKPGTPARLVRVQLASKLADDQAVVARVLELQGKLGAPSAVWDCPPAAGQVPTRRYQFKRGAADALDVIALLGQRSSATFYVAPAAQIRRSLAQARCVPTRPEHAARFPAVPAP
jgi:hypothetical protein